MKDKLIIYILLAIISFGSPKISNAEVYRCSNGVYTATPPSGMECKPLKAGVMCGSDGNKYFGEGASNVDTGTRCSAKPLNKSPLVNMDQNEAVKKIVAQFRAKHVKKKFRPNRNKKMELDQDHDRQHDIEKVLDCLSKGEASKTECDLETLLSVMPILKDFDGGLGKK